MKGVINRFENDQANATGVISFGPRIILALRVTRKQTLPLFKRTAKILERPAEQGK